MSQEEKGEVEYVDVECCHMCFSTERKLTSLDGVVDIYLLIVGLYPDCEESVKELRSCWECRAVLQRILKFRRQVQLARDILVTADALLLDSDTCMSKLKFTAIENMNLKSEFNLDTVRDVIVEIAPKHIENVYEYPISDDTKSSSDRNSNHGDFVEEDDSEQHIEDNNQTHETECICSMNTPVDADPLAMEIKEEDDFDEDDIFDAEPACDQNQTDIDEQAVSNIKTNVTNSNNIIPNINSVEKNDLSQNSNHSPVKPFITSTVLDNPSDDLTKTAQLVVVIDSENISRHNLTPRGDHVSIFAVKDKLDKDVIATQPSERNHTLVKNVVESMKPQLNINNIPSTSLQPVNIKQFYETQSNLMTVKNISPLQEKSQKQILHRTTGARHSQIDSKFIKTRPLTERVLSNYTAQYNVKGNFKPVAFNPREVIIVKPLQNVKHVMDRTHEILTDNMKKLYESLRLSAAKSNLAKIRVKKVKKSELNDFLEQARNNETYLASPFKCEFCILGFKEKRFLQRHMIRYSHATVSKNEFVCDVCISSLPGEKEPNTHQSTHDCMYSNTRDCLYSCTHEDFTSAFPLHVYHHYLEKHALNNKCITSPKLNAQVNQTIKPHAQNCETSVSLKFNLQVKQTIKPQAQSCETSAGTMPKKCKRKAKFRKAKLRKPKEIKSMKYEAFKPTNEDFEYMRTWVKLRPGIQCEDCFEPLNNNEKLEEHHKAHSESAGVHMCNICKLRFTTSELLREHKPVHDKWYKCKVDPACLYVAQKLSTMHVHIYSKHRTKRSSGIRPYISHECNICKKVFTSTASLKSHMLIHNKQHMCEVCGFIGATAFTLAKHKQQHATGERDILVCEFCPKRYSTEHSLRYHRSRHLQMKLYACKLCEEKFYCPNSRSSHVNKVHENKQKNTNKSYKCNLCHMEFPNNWTLTTHRSKHKELQRYKCDKCPKTFFMFNYLVNHQESHTYIYECDICGKVFPNRRTLKDHLNSKHSGGMETQRVKRERLQECSECGKVFQSVKKWRDHMKTHLIFPEDTPELS